MKENLNKIRDESEKKGCPHLGSFTHGEKIAFRYGWDIAMEQVKPLVEALEWLQMGHPGMVLNMTLSIQQKDPPQNLGVTLKNDETGIGIKS